jgi:hypothetical protein
LAEVALRQIEAANVISRNPDAIRAQAGIDQKAAKAMAEAARYQTCLDVLSEVASDSFHFRSAEVVITDSK